MVDGQVRGTEIVIERGSWSLRGIERGEGAPTVVFIHGWTCDHTTLSPQIDRMSMNHRCIALDIRGHGKSESPDNESWEIEDLAGDVVDAVDSLGLDPVVLVGHSMGGTIAYEAAARLGPRVHGLALLHPMPLRHTPESQALFDAVAGQLGSDESHTSTREAIVDGAMFTDETSPELRRHLRDLMLATRSDAATGCWGGLAHYDSAHQPMSDLNAVVVSGVRAANDDALIKTLLPLARIEHLSTGSFVQLEAAATVTDLVSQLVAAS